ncbi:hypothetical protein [Photobacterium ganghwense]|uniref:hypothetical protein n=1 Tax=Photobacterium ganghwense TaxID=320778 RepID=UPI001A8DDB25|nr:hypothetical protein [Photobacterium ganghwense]QSV17302.1 hypothetical protein FH974_20455 [Photobacterium ganghwense]
MNFIQGYQWYYAAITGYCATALLVMTNVPEQNITTLITFSIVAFSISFPIFTIKTMTFWIFSKYKVPEKNVALLINSNKYKQINDIGLYPLLFATLCFISHLNLIAGLAAAVTFFIALKYQDLCLRATGIDNEWFAAVRNNPNNAPTPQPKDIESL